MERERGEKKKDSTSQTVPRRRISLLSHKNLWLPFGGVIYFLAPRSTAPRQRFTRWSNVPCGRLDIRTNILGENLSNAIYIYWDSKIYKRKKIIIFVNHGVTYKYLRFRPTSTHFRPVMPFGNRKINSLEDFFNSVLSQCTKYYLPEILKFINVGILQSLTFCI